MNNQIIRIHNEANINAVGKYNSGHCKSIVCLETGAIYSSIKDAAREENVCYTFLVGHLQGKHKSVKGKHYRYLSDVLDDPNIMFTYQRKYYDQVQADAEDAQKWRAYQAELKAKAEAEAQRLEEERKAEAKRLRKIETLKRKIEYDTRIRDNAKAHLARAEERLDQDYAELRALEGAAENAN